MKLISGGWKLNKHLTVF